MNLLEEFQRLMESVTRMRAGAERDPQDCAAMLAGDMHLGGPEPGVLDAMANGIRKHHGVMDSASDDVAMALRAFDQASPAFVAALSVALQSALQAYLEKHFGAVYEEALREGLELAVQEEERVRRDADVAYL